MAKDIARLLSQLGRYRVIVSWLSSPISMYILELEAFWCYAIPRGNRLSWGVKYRGWEKITKLSTEITIYLGNGTR